MSTRLVILGLLKERPLHGYEIKHIIETRMGDWTNIAFGSIYFALRKLADDGLVKTEGTEQHGNRPSRKIYAITADGLKEFHRLLFDLWETVDQFYYPLDIGLFFLHEIPNKKRLPLIRKRISSIDHILNHLKFHETEIKKNPSVPPIAGAIFSHSLLHLKAEKQWLKEVEHDVEAGRYPV